jgi:hypothetical protein
MTISGAGTLAPLALETVSAVAFLSLLFNRLSLETKKRKKAEPYLLLLITFVLLTARPSGIIWLIVSVIIAFSSYPKNLKAKIRSNANILYSIAGLSTLDLIYLYFNRPPTGLNPPLNEFHLLSFISIEIQKLGEYFNNAIGIFGMDVYFPSIIYYIYAGMFFSLALIFYGEKNLTRATKLISLILIAMFAILPMAVNFHYRNSFVHFWQGRYMTPLIGLLISMFILWPKKYKHVYLLATISLLIVILGLFVSFIRYSNGLISGCCGTYVRANSEYQWQPGIFNIYWLMAFSITSVFLFGFAVLKTLQSNNLEFKNLEQLKQSF